MESMSGKVQQLTGRESVYGRMRTTDQVVQEANVKIRQAMDGTRNSYITRWGKFNDAIESIQEGEIIVVGGRPGSTRSLYTGMCIENCVKSGNISLRQS